MCMECIEVVEKGLFCISHMNIKMTIHHVVQVVKPVVKRLNLKTKFHRRNHSSFLLMVMC